MELSEVKGKVKEMILKEMLRAACRPSKFEHLSSTPVYKCKVCGNFSLSNFSHSCDPVNLHSHIIGDMELVGRIDNELLIIDMAAAIDKVLIDPKLRASILSNVDYR